MAKIVKPDLTYQWASAAGGGSVAPSSGKIQTGHIVEKPNYEYMNWLQNRQDTSIAYTFQMGVPEWDALVEYQYHANYKSYVQRNGLVYKALQVGTNKDPASEAAYWGLAFDNYGSAATVQSNLTTHITNYGTLASLSNAATARSNLGVYSTVQMDSALALKALLGGSNSQLFLVANGTTGYEAVNYSQLDTKASIAGNAAQEFAVSAATVGGNAVNKTQLDTKASIAGNAAQEFAVAAATTGNNAVNLTQLNTATTIQSGAIIRSVYAETTGVSLSSTPADIVTATISCAAGVATKFRVTAKIPFSVNSGNDTNATFILNNVTDGVNIDSSYHWDRDMSNAGMTGISVLQREITLTPVGTTVQFKAYGSTSVAGTAGNTYSGVAGYCTLIVEAIKI